MSLSTRESPSARATPRAPLTVGALAPVSLCLCLALALASCADVSDEPPRRPNVLFVVADTLRADHLSTYGYGWKTSPRLDELASRGVTFLDCTAQASWTMPSMISLMTGQPIFSTLYRIPGEFPVLAERFEEAGYRTGAFVGNSLLSEEAGFQRGIDRWAVRQHGGPKWRDGELETRALAFLDDQGGGAADGPAGDPRGDAVGGDERPWFLWLQSMITHAPYDPPRIPWRRRPGEVFTEAEQAGIRDVLGDVDDAQRKTLAGQISDLSAMVDKYDGEVLALDALIGRLVDALDERGLLDSTYIVLVSDHGETLFSRRQITTRFEQLRKWREHRGEPLTLVEYLKMEHDGTVYEELVRTPFVLAGPGLPAGRREQALVANIDVGPTLLGLCGLSSNLGAGRDLSGALLRDEPVPDAPWATTSCQQALAAKLPGGRKLVLPRTAVEVGFGLEPRVYDLRADPEERQPVVGLLGSGEGSDLSRELVPILGRLERAAETGPFVPFSGADADSATMEKLRELGYVR